MNGLQLISFGMILISCSLIFGGFLTVYYIIKKAVKNGILEALQEYNFLNNCDK